MKRKATGGSAEAPAPTDAPTDAPPSGPASQVGISDLTGSPRLDLDDEEDDEEEGEEVDGRTLEDAKQAECHRRWHAALASLHFLAKTNNPNSYSPKIEVLDDSRSPHSFNQYVLFLLNWWVRGDYGLHKHSIQQHLSNLLALENPCCVDVNRQHMTFTQNNQRPEYYGETWLTFLAGGDIDARGFSHRHPLFIRAFLGTHSGAVLLHLPRVCVGSGMSACEGGAQCSALCPHLLLPFTCLAALFHLSSIFHLYDSLFLLHAPHPRTHPPTPNYHTNTTQYDPINPTTPHHIPNQPQHHHILSPTTNLTLTLLSVSSHRCQSAQLLGPVSP